MDAWIAPGTQPFAIAALVMAGLVALEIVTALLGVSLSEMVGKGFDLDTHADDPGALGGLLGFVNPRGVPVLVLLIVALAAFSAVGYALQAAASGLWRPLPVVLAAAAALAGALPLTRLVTRGIARVIPRDETYAVGDDDLVGRVAEVTVGPLDQGPAGRVKVQDRHGNWHFPLARAAKGEPAIPVGAQVLLVDRESTAFRVIPAPEALRTVDPGRQPGLAH